MSVGVIVPLPAYTLNPAFIAKKAEDLGFESIWYHEHPVLPVKSESSPASGGEIVWTYAHFTEPYISLAMAAAVTSRIKLGTGITLVPERNPLILAKEISVLALHSGGRFIFGIGAVSLIIGVGYFLFKLLLKGVFEIFKAANKGSAEGSTRRPEDSP